MREKMIQIPELLYNQMCAYILIDEYRTEENRKTIEKGVYDKIDRKTNHDLYTKYKTSATEEQREFARKEYLDRIGVPESFRW